ncbi:MAG: hypothetical protein ACI4J3_04750, partial [Oscillospiraceae bacterium]
ANHWLAAQPAATVHGAEGDPVSYYDKLQVSGNRIIGENTGTPAQVKGMRFFCSNWSSQFRNSTYVNRMADDMQCKILR